MFFVYIIWSDSTGKYYIGQTSGLKNRLHRHNSGWEKSTKSGFPWKLVWSVEKPSRSEAMKLERKLKNLSTKRLMEFMLKYKSGS
jgi:putative endonuclease